MCSPFCCISLLGTESSPLDAAVKTVINLVSDWTSSCQISCRRLYSLVAALSARFALKLAIHPMWIRIVTGSDNERSLRVVSSGRQVCLRLK